MSAAADYLRQAFGPEYLATWVLVLAGIIGIILTVETLRSIRRQTDALVERQRPKLTASGRSDITEVFLDPFAHRVKIDLENKGMAPAYDLVCETWIEILPFPFNDFTPAATYFKSTTPVPVVSYPNALPYVVNMPIQRDVPRGEIQAVLKLELYVCVRLQVTFRDAFGSRCSNYGYFVQEKGFGFLPKHNDFR